MFNIFCQVKLFLSGLVSVYILELKKVFNLKFLHNKIKRDFVKFFRFLFFFTYIGKYLNFVPKKQNNYFLNFKQ